MKMQEKKLVRFSIYKNVANVLFVLTIIFGVLILVGVTFGYSYVSRNEAEVLESVSEYLVEAEVPIMITEEFDIPDGLVYIFAAHIVLSAGLIAYLFKSASRMFGFVVKDETPFTQKVVKSLKSMGIAFFVYTGLKFILGSIVFPAVGTMIRIGFDNIEYKYILFGVLLLALGEIFEFGMNLQKDSESIV